MSRAFEEFRHRRYWKYLILRKGLSMSRKDTRTIRNIRSMYAALNLKEEEVYHKSKMILSVYRDVVWTSLCRCDMVCEETEYLYGRELDTALLYLTEFAPNEQKQDFENRITCLFETKWMVDLIDTAMTKVLNYHTNGKIYFQILAKCYLGEFKYTESEILELLVMERSTYYDRKKEAVLLLGVAIWGFAIPQLQGLFSETEDVQGIPAFFAGGKNPTISRLTPY